jgi:hypothetical protein
VAGGAAATTSATTGSTPSGNAATAAVAAQQLQATQSVKWPGQAAESAAARATALAALLPQITASTINMLLGMDPAVHLTQEGTACRQLACDVLNSLLSNGPLLAAAGRQHLASGTAAGSSDGSATTAAAAGSDGGAAASTGELFDPAHLAAGVQLLQPELMRLTTALINTAVKGLSQVGSSAGAGEAVSQQGASAAYAAGCGSGLALEVLVRLLQPLGLQQPDTGYYTLTPAAQEVLYQLTAAAGLSGAGSGSGAGASTGSTGAAAGAVQDGTTADSKVLKGLTAEEVAVAKQQAQQMLTATHAWHRVCRTRAAVLLDAVRQGWDAAMQKQQQEEGGSPGMLSPAAWVAWGWLGDCCSLLACMATDWRDATAVQQFMNHRVLQYYRQQGDGPVAGSTAPAAGWEPGNCCDVPLLPQRWVTAWAAVSGQLAWPLSECW